MLLPLRSSAGANCWGERGFNSPPISKALVASVAAAIVALIDAGACGLAFKLLDALAVDVATVRANGTMRPMDSLRMLASLVGIGVNQGCKIDYRRNSLGSLSQIQFWYAKCVIGNKFFSNPP